MVKTRSHDGDSKGKELDVEDLMESRLSRLEDMFAERSKMMKQFADMVKALAGQQLEELQSSNVLLEEKSEPQFQVTIANSEILKSIEPGEVDLGMENLEYVVMDESLEKEWVHKRFESFDVDGDVERDQKMLSMEKVCCAHKAFAKMSQHKETLGRKKKQKGFKSWRFKFKHRVAPRDSKSGFEVNRKQNQYPCLFLASNVTTLVHKLFGGEMKFSGCKMLLQFLLSAIHKKLEMRFMTSKQKVLLLGMKPGSVGEIRAHKLNRIQDDEVQVSMLCVQELPRESEAEVFFLDCNSLVTTISLEVDQLLRQFHELLEKILPSFFRLKHKWRSRLSHSFSEIKQRMIVSVWKSFGYLMEDMMEEDQKQQGDSELLVIVPDFDAKGGVGMDKKQSHLSLRNNRVWDPGGSLVKMQLHETLLISSVSWKANR